MDILCAINLPPITASPVHRACPSVPPIVTPTTFCRKKNIREIHIVALIKVDRRQDSEHTHTKYRLERIKV